MKFKNLLTSLILLFSFHLSVLTGQVSTGGTYTTAAHNKEVIGYITQWDAWKAESAGVPSAGALTHLNIDYSKYTILNFSFFGVANDGSLHSADLRNKNIHQDGVVQEPGDLFYTDIYSSWDLYILFGEIEPVQWITEDIALRAAEQGFEVEVGGNTWSNSSWRVYNKSLPLPLKKEGGAPGLLELAHQNGVKVMASIGGWSMCKHFPEMAADPVKRARFIEDCERLIEIGFDGIDLDWEYPGAEGMNFTGTQADFANFTTLVQEIRNAIGPDKLITSAMSAAPSKIEGFDWSSLVNIMDYFNMMTYDFNGGWSDIAGHNSPLYSYGGAEAPEFNWKATFDKMVELGVPTNMINMGVPFYGRGVVCDSNATLNVPTVKTDVNLQPDGLVSTCADFTNWPLGVYDGTPNYFYIKQKTGFGTTNGWTKHWDDEAKVPYLTNGNYFLSYDDEESIGYKAQFVNDNNLGGVIVWTVYGDLEIGGTATSFGTKLKRWSDVNSVLVNSLNDVFATGFEGGDDCLSVDITPYIGVNDGSLQNVSQQTVSAGDKVTLSPQPATGAWSWTGSDGFSYSNRELVLDNIQASGSYTVTRTNEGDCPATQTFQINVTDGESGNASTRIVGYMPSWRGTAAAIPYDKLTHIIYAFGVPNSSGDGSIDAVPNAQKLQDIVAQAHQNDVQVLLALGGWTDLNNPGFEGIVASAQRRENFANNCVALCNQYNLDGIDIDWEYPINNAANYAFMMQALSEKLHAAGKILTAAVPGSDYYGQYINADALAAMDFLNVMAYDGDSGAGHSPYSFAVSALNYWVNKGMPAENTVLGVPFYARPSWTTYADLLAQGASPQEDFFNGDYYNGIPTIRQKAELSKSYGGIMIWEITQDATGENSLLAAIYDVLMGNGSGDDGTGDEPGVPCWNTWVPGAYNGGAEVSHNGKNYRAKWWTNGEPGTDEVWEYISDCGSAVSVTPESPANFDASAVSQSQIDLSWNDLSTNETGFVIDFSTDQSNWSELTTVASNVTSYQHNGLNASATYYYRVAAFNDNGTSNYVLAQATTMSDDDGTGDEPGVPCWNTWVPGAYNGGAEVSHNGKNYRAKWWTNGEPGTDEVWEYISDCGSAVSVTPESPANFDASAVSQSRIDLSWNDLSTNETGFVIDFSTDQSNWSELTTVASNVTSYQHNGLNASATYYYRVAAFNNNGTSDYVFAQATTMSDDDGGDSGNPPVNASLPDKILSGYWHTWGGNLPFIKLRDVDSEWDVINIAFAEPVQAGSTNGEMKFVISGLTADYTISDFKADVQLLQSQGKKVVLSIGGYEGYFSLTSDAAVATFVNDIKGFIDEYGFDGIDIDLEQSSVQFLSGNDPDFRNSVSPKVVYMIQAIRQIVESYNSDFILSFAPETFYFQMGHTYYGGLNQYVDVRSGVYIPMIYALRDRLTYVQSQLYNSAAIKGTDGIYYDMGTVDGIVAMTEMVIEGFSLNGNDNYIFPGLRPDQVVVGVPASQGAAGSGQVTNAQLQEAFMILYDQYPSIRGIMTWSVNWDAFQNDNGFASENGAFLDGLKLKGTGVISIASDIDGDESVMLYPNPVDNVLFVNGVDQYAGFVIYNLQGKTVLNGQGVPIDVSSLDKGTYVLRIFTGTGVVSEIFVKL